MKHSQIVRALMAFTAAASIAAPSHATFHDWRIKEIFSNHDGTVQFIEFFTTSGGQNFLNSHTIDATSDGVLVTYTFPGQNLSGSTANKHFLLATAGFGALAGGVAPDFALAPLPSNFFNPNAANITINFAHGFDIATFAGSQLPKDGVNSLTDTVLALFNNTDNFVVGVNSPTNFAGASGSVNVPPPGANPADFNGVGGVNGADLALWRSGFGSIGAAATKMQGNADNDADVDGADFLIWQQQNGTPAVLAATSTVPEPAAGTLLAIAAAAGVAARYAQSKARARRRT